MPRINVLPKNIADLIAAGEVVERPSSVIKEFLENSIDAGAKNVTVEIKNGGKTYIRVTDNGCGIDKEDVRKKLLDKGYNVDEINIKVGENETNYGQIQKMDIFKQVFQIMSGIQFQERDIL